MNKNSKLKPTIKNKQLADSLNLDKLKNKFKKQNEPKEEAKPKKVSKETTKPKIDTPVAKEAPVVKEVKEKKEIPVAKVEEKAKVVVKPKVEVKKEEEPVIPKYVQPERPPRPIKKRHELSVGRDVKIIRREPAKKPEVKKEEVSKEKLNLKRDTDLEKHLTTKKDKTPFKSHRPKSGFQDLAPLKKQNNQVTNFDSRSRHGLANVDEGNWQRRRRRPHKRSRSSVQDITIRPTELSVRLPITIKNLAAAMKIKTSQIVTILFKQGLTLTLNDYLDDETTVQLIGQEFSCEITIDTKEQDKIQVTDQSLEEEVKSSDAKEIVTRPPVIAFMGHVDHGKTSLIDNIRKSNRVAYEAGAITQHIGAFQCKTSHGPITVLDTPGHEAFSAMRNRGATVTDIVVLVVAGDEGIKDQTVEAIKHAKAAGVNIIVAINKSDKENFDPEPIYRGLADHELLSESWGGSTIMVKCSAKTGEGISELLELIALQSEILELKANPNCRARGTVLESEIHKGMGNVTTLLVQNGTLNVGDSLVFDQYYAKIKTMINDLGKTVQHAGPSMAIEITGISGLPDAGCEFIVVDSEKEAKEVSQMRYKENQANKLSIKKVSFKESFLETDYSIVRKSLNIIVRADVQGSLEALKDSLNAIKTEKIDLNIIRDGVGEVTESDIHFAKTSGATIIGFHTRLETHAEELKKQVNVTITMPKIIYEAVDYVKDLMISKLDKIEEEHDKGKAEVKAVFKASRIGKIAGCVITTGTVSRNDKARVIRDGKSIFRGAISSIKREKDDAKEVKKGMECGLVLNGFNDYLEGDIIESFGITYLTQTL